MKFKQFILENENQDSFDSFIDQFYKSGISFKNKINKNNVDPDELKKGIEIEQEHVMGNFSKEIKDKLSLKIALDHLSEIPDYYTRLIKMESEAKSKIGENNA